MLGAMRWFDEERGDGMIAGEAGEGCHVLADGFVGQPDAPRRARLRSHRVVHAWS